MNTLTRNTPWSGEVPGFVLLNVAGGAAVLASYAWGLDQLGDDAARAWGGVPSWLRPFYQVSMITAAAGYFPMTLFAIDGLRSERSASRIVFPLYAGILACSALWLPLTCRMLERPSAPLWWTIRADLAVVGLCSVALLAWILRRPGDSRLRTAAAVGAAAFCLQTAVLDAIVWPAYFDSGN